MMRTSIYFFFIFLYFIFTIQPDIRYPAKPNIRYPDIRYPAAGYPAKSVSSTTLIFLLFDQRLIDLLPDLLPPKKPDLISPQMRGYGTDTTRWKDFHINLEAKKFNFYANSSFLII